MKPSPVAGFIVDSVGVVVVTGGVADQLTRLVSVTPSEWRIADTNTLIHSSLGAPARLPQHTEHDLTENSLSMSACAGRVNIVAIPQDQCCATNRVRGASIWMRMTPDA